METTYKRGIIIALVATFILVVATIVVWKLKFYDDVNQKLSKTSEEYKTAKATADTLDKELLAQAIAQERLVLANEQVAYFRQRFRGLNFNLKAPGPLNRTWIGYMNEYFADYGLNVRRELVQAADETGVVLTTSLKVDAPPQVPESVTAPPNGFLKPLVGGTLSVTITGQLPDILRFLERVNRSPILMTVGAIKLEGFSPNIKATFTLTPYLVTSGPDAKLPAAAAPATPEGGAPPEGAPAPSGGAAAGA